MLQPLMFFAVQGLAGVPEDTAPYRSLRMAAEAPAPDGEAYGRAAAGEVVVGIDFVEGVSAGKGWGLAIFDAAVEAVWMAVNDPVAWPARFGNLDQSLIVHGIPKTGNRQLFQRMPVPIIRDRWWVVQQHHNAALYTASSGGMWELAATSVDKPDLTPEGWAHTKGGTQIA